MDAAAIFPATAGRVPQADLRRFMELCEACSVRDECLDAALESPYEPHGVWGGLMQAELKPLWVELHPMPKAEIASLLGPRRGLNRDE